MPVIHDKKERVVKCDVCGELLLLETEDGDFYRPQSCEHYKVIDCAFPECEDCPLAKYAQVFPTKYPPEIVYCIVPRHLLKKQ